MDKDWAANNQKWDQSQVLKCSNSDYGEVQARADRWYDFQVNDVENYWWEPEDHRLKMRNYEPTMQSYEEASMCWTSVCIKGISDYNTL